MIRNVARFAAMFTCSALLCGPAHAGSVLELLTTEYKQEPPIIGTVQISTSGDSSRLEITSVSSNESGGMIYRADSKEMIAIDHEAQEYFVIDQETMDRIAAQVSAQLQAMQEELAAMPPEQRALAEQMMQMKMPDADAEAVPASMLEKTGESDTVSGFECEYYDVMREGRKIRDLCMTSWEDIEEGREVASAMMKLADFFENMRKAFSGTGGLDVMDRQQEMFAYMEALNGYPVYSRDYDASGRLESEARLQSAGHEEISPAMFEPPPGYMERALQ